MKCPRPEKRKHTTKGGAEMEREFLRRSDPEAALLDVYLCQCRMWHVGNPTLGQRIRDALHRKEE